jgi:hypothetical protein
MPAVRPAAADAACSSSGGCVNVLEYQNGSATLVQQFTPAQLAQDSDVPNNTCYDKRFEGEAKGETNGTVCVSNALSVHGLLAASGVDVGDSQLHTAVLRNDGTWATLTTPELQDPAASGTFVSSQVPAVYSSGNSVGYVRPLTSFDDANEQDIFTPNNQSDPLDVYVFTGPTLSVTAKASKHNHVTVGTPVRFTATVTGSSNPSSLQYAWSFSDGHAASTASLSHAFAASGTYSVLLKVTGANDGSGGISDPLIINVGKTSKTPSPPPSQPPSTHSPSPTHSATPPLPPPPHGSPPTPHHPKSGSGAGGAHPTLPGLGNLHLGSSFASRLGARLSGQQPLVADGGAGQLPIVDGQLITSGQQLSLSAAASESSTVSDSALAATAESTSWSAGAIPLYVGGVLLLLGVGVARERGWLTLRRR